MARRGFGRKRRKTDSMSKSPAPGGEILLYQTQDGRTRLEVRFEAETAWLTQVQRAELFQASKQNVSLHVQNLFCRRRVGLEGNRQGILDSSKRGRALGPAARGILQS